MKTIPVSPAVGVQVDGLDLRSPLANQDQQALKRLLDENQLLLFRNQAISPQDQVRLLSIFGPVSDEKGDGNFYSFVSNVRPDGLFGDWPLPFHSDFSFREYSPTVFSLYAEEVEGHSTPTLFANTVRAARLLPAPLRSRVQGKLVVNCDDFTKEQAVGYGQRAQLLKLPAMPPQTTHPRASHPVLKPHPRTGNEMLFVTEMHSSHIEGLGSDESEALIQELFSRQYAADNLYTHHWQRGDLVVWDNLALQHGRKYANQQVQHARRTLRRVAVSEKSVKELLAGTEYKRSGGFEDVAKSAR